MSYDRVILSAVCRDIALALSAVGNQGQWTDLKVCPYFREVAEKVDRHATEGVGNLSDS